jgi:hypothetical protein
MTGGGDLRSLDANAGHMGWTDLAQEGSCEHVNELFRSMKCSHNGQLLEKGLAPRSCLVSRKWRDNNALK